MGIKTGIRRYLSDEYAFNGFRPQHGKVRGVFGGPQARILPLERRSKKHAVGNAAQYSMGGMTARAS